MKRLFTACIALLFAAEMFAARLSSFAEEEKAFSHLICLKYQGDPGDPRAYVSDNNLTIFLNTDKAGLQLKRGVKALVDNGMISLEPSRKIYGYKILKQGTLLNIRLYYTPLLDKAVEPELAFLDYAEEKEDIKEPPDPVPVTVVPEPPEEEDPADHRRKKDEWVIVLDPGHGGKSSGAVGPTGYKEKDLVLDVSRRVRDKLSGNKRIKIVMTRDSDVFIPLSGRAKIANKIKADLFISIHANAVAGKKRRKIARGVETFFLGEALNDEDRALAIKENEDIKYESEYTDAAVLEMILSDITQNRYLKESSDLAMVVQKNLVGSTGWIDRGVKQNIYYVLRYCYMPSILIEMGFISHPAEEKLLKQSRYKEMIASQIAESIREYVRKHDEIYEN